LEYTSSSHMFVWSHQGEICISGCEWRRRPSDREDRCE